MGLPPKFHSFMFVKVLFLCMLVIVRQVGSSSTFETPSVFAENLSIFFLHVKKKKIKHTCGFILLEGTKLLLGCVVVHMHINPKNFEVLF